MKSVVVLFTLLVCLSQPVWAVDNEAARVSEGAINLTQGGRAPGRNLEGRDVQPWGKYVPLVKFSTERMLYVLVTDKGGCQVYTETLANALVDKLGDEGEARNVVTRIMRPTSKLKPGDFRLTVPAKKAKGEIRTSSASGAASSDSYSTRSRRWGSNGSSSTSSYDDSHSEASAEGSVTMDPILEVMASDGEFNVVSIRFGALVVEERRLIAMRDWTSSSSSRSWSSRHGSDRQSNSSYNSSSMTRTGDVVTQSMDKKMAWSILNPLTDQLWTGLAKKQWNKVAEIQALERELERLREEESTSSSSNGKVLEVEVDQR